MSNSKYGRVKTTKLSVGKQQITDEESFLIDFYDPEDDGDGELKDDFEKVDAVGIVMAFNPKVGYVYKLHNYSCPKVFTGLYYECINTDQKIPANAGIVKDYGLPITDWRKPVWKPERFS